MWAKARWLVADVDLLVGLPEVVVILNNGNFLFFHHALLYCVLLWSKEFYLISTVFYEFILIFFAKSGGFQCSETCQLFLLAIAQ